LEELFLSTQIPKTAEPTLTQAKVHELKTWPGFFNDVLTGDKTFEIRRDDRGFKVGDILTLREFEPSEDRFTGRSLSVVVTYITVFNQPASQVVMAIKKV
jgi:uncharacterized protein YqfB (UPF0267 family)